MAGLQSFRLPTDKTLNRLTGNSNASRSTSSNKCLLYLFQW